MLLDIEEEATIRADIPWGPLSKALREQLLNLEIPPGRITLVYYYMSGEQTGSFNLDVVEVGEGETKERTTIKVYKRDAVTAVARVSKQTLPIHTSARIYVREIRRLIERLARSYRSWEDRTRTMRG